MANGLFLNDLLGLKELSHVKIKFNQHNGYSNPRELFLTNPDIVNKEWLFWRTEQRYFNVGQIAICLLKIDHDLWLLTTVKKVTKELGVVNGINYEGEEIPVLKPFFGRVLVKFHKHFPSQGRFAAEIIDQLEVSQILPAVYEGEEFPGYDKVRLSFGQLETIILRHKRDWEAAMQNQKAVYLITDKENGKLYVGSATGDNGMLLQRWAQYVYNGHGGNKELLKIIANEGFDYVKKNFQYSILENYNSRVDKLLILERESWWKETLRSKEPFGYNCN